MYCKRILTRNYEINYMDQCITTYVLHVSSITRDIVCVVITRQSDSPIFKFSRPYIESRSVWSMFSCTTCTVFYYRLVRVMESIFNSILVCVFWMHYMFMYLNRTYRYCILLFKYSVSAQNIKPSTLTGRHNHLNV